jgi:hypothetical protein
MRIHVIGLLIAFSFPVAAQSGLPPGVRGADSGMATRSVSTYLQRERDLQDAIDTKNTGGVKRFLAADFEGRPAGNADAIDAGEWLRREMAAKPTNADVRNLSVREFDDIAVVSFSLERKRLVKGKPVATSTYVVDVWRQSTAQLQVRYMAPLAKSAPALSRPSGRE